MEFSEDLKRHEALQDVWRAASNVSSAKIDSDLNTLVAVNQQLGLVAAVARGASAARLYEEVVSLSGLTLAWATRLSGIVKAPQLEKLRRLGAEKQDLGPPTGVPDSERVAIQRAYEESVEIVARVVRDYAWGHNVEVDGNMRDVAQRILRDLAAGLEP